jgi:hypothetical protein
VPTEYLSENLGPGLNINGLGILTAENSRNRREIKISDNILLEAFGVRLHSRICPLIMLHLPVENSLETLEKPMKFTLLPVVPERYCTRLSCVRKIRV